MFKPCLNPAIKELTQTIRTRRYNLSDIQPIKGDDGPICVWCLGALKGKQRKWCGESCNNAAYAWANPQSESGLAVLLGRQKYLCAGCNHDWNPIAESLIGKYGVPKKLNRFTEFHEKLVKMVKNRAIGFEIEVDHVIPISKGGQSLGHENHQAICTGCHKAKTKIDNSGPRKIRK